MKHKPSEQFSLNDMAFSLPQCDICGTTKQGTRYIPKTLIVYCEECWQKGGKDDISRATDEVGRR